MLLHRLRVDSGPGQYTSYSLEPHSRRMEDKNQANQGQAKLSRPEISSISVIEHIFETSGFFFPRYRAYLWTGLHKLRYPGIRDMSTWSKFGAHGEHGDVFLFSNLGAL